MRSEAGMLIAGRYLLAEAVGQGGMGRVWRGHDQLLDRVVAVKEVTLPAQSPEERAELLARTMREARAAARLDHPGLITIYDVIEHEDSPWIVMQFVPGTSLRARIDGEGRLPWQEVADIGAQIAEALAMAHGAGIVHRDLKPDNILLSGSRAIVTDFGIARIMDSATRLTSTGMMVGTPAYMAPEQLDGGATGPAADLWALGATLYTAVEGTQPFAGDTMSALITAILTKTPPRPRHADAALAEVLASLLAKEPAQRTDAPATARVLGACRTGELVQVPGPGSQPEPTAPGAGSASSLLRDGAEAVASAMPRPADTSHPSFPGMPRPPSADSGLAPIARPPSGPAEPARQHRRRLAVVILSVAAVLSAAAGAGAAFLTKGSQSPGIASSSTRPQASQHAGTSAPARTVTGHHASGAALTGPVSTSLVATLADPHGADAVAFGPDGTLATEDLNGATLWDVSTRSITETLTDPAGSTGASSLAFGPDGTLAVGDLDGGTYLWNTTIQSVTNTLYDPNGAGVLSVAFGPGNTLATGDDNGNVYLWDLVSGRLITTLPVPNGGAPYGLAFGPDGTLAVTGFNEVGPAATAQYSGDTYLWNTATRKVIATFPAPKGTAPWSLAFGPDGTLAIGNVSGSISLWNTATSSLTTTLPAPGAGTAGGLAFGPDGILAVADDDCEGACLGGAIPENTYLWNTATKHVITTLPAPQGEPPLSVAFGPDGTVAVADANGSTYLWRVSIGKS